MTIAPEEVSNVWAGDAVRFDTPVSSHRRPPLWAYLLFAAVSIAMAAAVFGPGGSTGSAGVLLGLPAALGAILLGAELMAWINMRRARRAASLRGEPQTLNELAILCWLRPLAQGKSRRHFDVEDWIRRSGPTGPRLLLCEFPLAPVSADPNVTEEEPIDFFVEHNPARRKMAWAGLGFVVLNVLLFLTIGRIRHAWQPYVVLACFGTAAIGLMARLGLGHGTFSSILAAPGRVSRLTARGSLLFTRDDSVLLLEPVGTSASVRVRMVRSDGRTTTFSLSLGAEDPMLARLLSRWCWRGGEGAEALDSPLRNDAPLLADSPVPQGT